MIVWDASCGISSRSRVRCLDPLYSRVGAQLSLRLLSCERLNERLLACSPNSLSGCLREQTATPRECLMEETRIFTTLVALTANGQYRAANRGPGCESPTNGTKSLQAAEYPWPCMQVRQGQHTDKVTTQACMPAAGDRDPVTASHAPSRFL